MLRVYFDKYDTFVFHRKQVAKIVNESESTIDRWKKKAYGPEWSKDEGSPNSRVTYMIDRVVDFLIDREENKTI